MSIELALQPLPRTLGTIERAILETLAYSDIFDYPLCIEELQRYLPVRSTPSELVETINQFNGRIKMIDGYYVLAGHEHLIRLRQNREAISHPLFQRAVRYGHLLGCLPFIRMVALTGSLAMQNCDETADIDYLLVATQGRVWIARAFALLLGHVTALFGNTLCPNLIISDRALEWQQQDAYSAHELCQMIPITGIEVYVRMRKVNSWSDNFLPNAVDEPDWRMKEIPGSHQLRTLFETPLRSRIGDWLETWEMNRKIKRFTRLPGYGSETHFNRDICQGNFNQHGLHIKTEYLRRLANLGL